jgi:hypothetical protein
MQPANGWTAVARGALTNAMADVSVDLCKVRINSRIACKCYGTLINTAFTEDEHESWRKYWSDYGGGHQIDIINWLVRRGDVIEESKPDVASFFTTQLCNDGPIQSRPIRFYSFNDGVAPKYKDHNVKHLVTLTVDLSSIPTDLYEVKIGADGESYYRFVFQVKATFFSAHTEYALMFAGQSYGSVQARYV